MTNGTKENEHDISDVDNIFDNKDSFSEESVIFDDEVKENESDPQFDSAASSQILYNNNAQQQEEFKPALDSKFYAIRITGGQEQVVANILQNKINTKKIKILSILVLDNFKGYIIVEAPDSNVAFEALHGVRHVRGQIRGELPFKDIEGYLVKKPVVTELNIDDAVEVIAGPFKAMKAKITRVDYEKQEATVVLLDSPYQIPVTVDANYLKKLMQ
jgi:transcription termination/antitermination protein NusG